MSGRLLCLALLLMGTGCQTFRDSAGDSPCEPRRGRRNGAVVEYPPDGCTSAPYAPGACPPGPCPSAPCPSGPCLPERPVCQPAPKPAVRAPAPVESRTEVQTQAQQHAVGAIAQDILLVPRTVYVPYAAQVPVAPARLAGLAAPGPVHTVTEQRVTTQQVPLAEPREPLAAPRECDTTTLELLKALRALNDKLDEQRRMMMAPAPEQLPHPCPVPECPPPPCPPPHAPCNELPYHGQPYHGHPAERLPPPNDALPPPLPPLSGSR